MKKIVKYFFIIISAIFLIYLSLPSPDFPENSSKSIQSKELADMEDANRKGYYSDEDREDVINYYKNSFDTLAVFNIQRISYRLNYPPENAQTIIRDQTRSTFLEEIVHPFRESLFINGFEPKYDQDVIIDNGKRWKQKIIVKYVESSLVARFVFGVSTLALLTLIYKESINFLKDIGFRSRPI